jgi:hypothetical protein
VGHPQVIHPNELNPSSDEAVDRVNDWLAGHLSWVFGLAWTIWVFISVPLVALVLPGWLQNKIFYLASGWIQLWALPLFVYIGNKLQKTSDAQSDTMTRALTHIATVEDQNAKLILEVKELISQNTQLTEQIHNLLNEKENENAKQS